MKNRKYILIPVIRQAIADYMGSEGCSCCRNIGDHNASKGILGKLLNVPMFSDKSGYNFSKCSTKDRSKSDGR